MQPTIERNNVAIVLAQHDTGIVLHVDDFRDRSDNNNATQPSATRSNGVSVN